ncbi:hypothetical protein [Streptomyces sp. NPDC008240]|uniref:hypothetical protein n=1 Tax=Streptomyces sp. NPDC008240 TaxID=3364822 RepID=UPI0036E1BF4C
MARSDHHDEARGTMFGTGPANSHAQQPRPLHPHTPTLRRRPRAGVAAVAVGLAVAGVLASTVPTAQAASHGGTARCDGRGADATALIRHESDIVIKAPPSTVWKLRTDVERWPSWQLEGVSDHSRQSAQMTGCLEASMDE